MRQDFLPGQVCINTDLWKCEFGRLFAQARVRLCSVHIRRLGRKGGGLVVNNVTIYLKELIITLV